MPIATNSALWGAAVYDALIHDPNHAFVIASYASFKRTIMRQWNELCNGGMTFIPSLDDPYRNSQEMFEEVEQYGRLRVYADNGASLPDDHPMKELVPGNIKGFAVYNDVFRAVHDIMGHVVSGGSFGPRGEEKAWQAHRATLPPIAHNALWCETRGQNVWTNFAHNHAMLPLAERPFGEQKVGLIPPFLTGSG